MYASFSTYLYLNATLGGYLLAPLLEYQELSQYSNPYAAHDLGDRFIACRSRCSK